MLFTARRLDRQYKVGLLSHWSYLGENSAVGMVFKHAGYTIRSPGLGTAPTSVGRQFSNNSRDPPRHFHVNQSL